MDIFLCLSHTNPEYHSQAIPLLAQSGSPYAIELLRMIASQTNNIKTKDACKRAMQELKSNISANGKIKNHDFGLHVEILMAAAVLNVDNVATSRDAKRSIARAYALDKKLLENPDYLEIAERAFQGNLYDLEHEIRQFVRQDVKNHRVLKAGYPVYMYLIDVPVAIILTLTLATVSNPDFAIRTLRNIVYTWDFIDWEMVQIVAFALVCLLVLRILYIVFDQWHKQQVLGWEKEARRLQIDYIEGEIQKLLPPR